MKILEILSDAVWGVPTVALVIFTGLIYTAALGLPQLTRLKEMFSVLKEGGGGKGLSAVQSLCSSLAATVGTGSVIGVATAITLGGPGAVFWLWVSAFFGMAVAYAEGVLSIKFRRVSDTGERTGGMWCVLEDGLGSRASAKIYAALCLLASFGMGSMAQTNSASAALESTFGVRPWVCGLFISLLVGACLINKAGFTGKLCVRAVPLLAGLYIVGALAIIIKNSDALPGVMSDILKSAFGLRPAVSGAVGYTVKTAVSIGCRRGIFSNEAGLGTTAPIHAASTVDDPRRQGIMNMLEVTVDTFIICTLTALAILCSGADKTGADGAELVIKSAEAVFGRFSSGVVALSVAGFAAATAVGWSQIGLYAAKYLMPGYCGAYRAIFFVSAFSGAVMSLQAVWRLSDIFNGLMAVPCLAGLLLSVKTVRNEDKQAAVKK